MKTQKILILGITGNLAKLKILPSIGQYFDLYSSDVNIEIYGYSRSRANLDEIKLLIQNEIKGTQNFPKITIVQGEYTDHTFYDELVLGLGENDSLVVYMAVPPSVYAPFLQNSCPYSKSPIDILIEKPFGEDYNEAINILDIVAKCDLHQRVHFIDHYLFKSALQFNILEVKRELSYNNLSFGNINKISITALETVDVKERGGYYDTNGAIKDMFPHLYSLYNFGLKFFGKPSLDNTKWEINNILTSQYDGYKIDVNNNESKTESYFKAELSIPNLGQKIINVEMESGKVQPQKLTELVIEFESGSKLIFQIAPQIYLKLVGKNNKIIKEFEIKNTSEYDHTRVFENVFASNFGKFVPNENVLEYWQLYNKIINKINL